MKIIHFEIHNSSLPINESFGIGSGPVIVICEEVSVPSTLNIFSKYSMGLKYTY